MTSRRGFPGSAAPAARHAGRLGGPLFLNQVWVGSRNMSERTARRGPQGRPSKGERHTQSIRFPLPLYEAILEGAGQANYDNVNDFVVDVMYHAHEAGLFPQPSGQMHLSASA